MYSNVCCTSLCFLGAQIWEFDFVCFFLFGEGLRLGVLFYFSSCYFWESSSSKTLKHKQKSRYTQKHRADYSMESCHLLHLSPYNHSLLWRLLMPHNIIQIQKSFNNHVLSGAARHLQLSVKTCWRGRDGNNACKLVYQVYNALKFKKFLDCLLLWLELGYFV